MESDNEHRQQQDPSPSISHRPRHDLVLCERRGNGQILWAVSSLLGRIHQALLHPWTMAISAI